MSEQKKAPAPLSKDEIKALPPFDALSRDAVVLVCDEATMHAACRQLLEQPVLGFDTESRPTFRVGEVSTGPHLLQLATPSQAYLFQLEKLGDLAPLRALMAAGTVHKVGFGLSSDKVLLKSKLDIDCAAVHDIGTLFRQTGARHTVGAVQAVAQLFGRHYRKSKRLSTSNWASATLSDAQCLYAANDAYVALRVYLALAGAAR
ncbi:3'-5' exonuclease [Crenobacter cavernae]|nr:3'-5' exonuclease [Crenobacter cavernae]